MSHIADRYSTSVEAFMEANGVANPNLIFLGQTLIVPSGREASSFSTSFEGYGLVPGTIHKAYLGPVSAPLRGNSSARSRTIYEKIINQFMVEKNPRYARYNGITYCNVFVWDVTRAMGAEIPHVATIRDEADLAPRRTWLSANGMHWWLNQHGVSHNWRRASMEEAQRLANLGFPAVVTEYGAPVGHIGIVRPGEMLNGPALAQAGTRNINFTHTFDQFPLEGTQFFVNDAGKVD